MYDFNRCKLCGEISAKPHYQLQQGKIYLCTNCDFHFLAKLDEITTIESNSQGLTEQAIAYIDKRIDEADGLLPHRLKLVKEFVDLAGAKCLDLGAGVGQFSKQLQKEQAEVYGIEPSGVRRDYAKLKLNLDLRAELIDEDYWQSGFGEYFDAICLWDAIEHINFPVETLTAACRLLKPSGHLFLDTPNRATFSYRLSEKLYLLSRGQIPLFLESFYSTAPYGHKQIFTSEQLQKIVKQLGLQVATLRHSWVSSLFRGDKLILACQKTD